MNNKRLKIMCITGITTISILLVVFVCWIYYKNNDRIIVNEKKERIISQAEDDKETKKIDVETPKPVDINDTTISKDDKIKPDTNYILQTFYVDAVNGEKLIEEELPVPADFIALNKNSLQKLLDEYVADMPLEEYLNGMISYEIIEFDDNRLILRKTYGTDWNRDAYYICDSNGEIVVYYSDRETVYEYTGIKTKDLSDDEKVKLAIGYYVNNDEELYALLESYSS